MFSINRNKTGILNRKKSSFLSKVKREDNKYKKVIFSYLLSTEKKEYIEHEKWNIFMFFSTEKWGVHWLQKMKYLQK